MKTVPLREVATIARHGVDPETLDPTTPYIGLEHIARGGRIVGDETLASTAVKSTKFAFTDHQVLFGKLRPNLGKIARPDFNGVCSTDILPISPSPLMDRGFLFHYLSHPTVVDYAASQATGANLPRLSPAALAEFQVPLPPVEDQRRIAAILDRADTLRRKRHQVINHLSDVAQALFDAAFNDDLHNATTTLNELADVSSGITKGRRTSEATRPIPYLAVVNVQAGHLDLQHVKEIAATESEIKRYALAEGDIVLTEGGDPDKLGRGTVWRTELPLCLHQNHIFRVRVTNDQLHPDYLAAYLASKPAKGYFLRAAKQTTGIASINMTQLRATPIYVPAISDQQEYLRRVRKVTELRHSADAYGRTLEDLFTSLQSRAFCGDL